MVIFLRVCLITFLGYSPLPSFATSTDTDPNCIAIDRVTKNILKTQIVLASMAAFVKFQKERSEEYQKFELKGNDPYQQELVNNTRAFLQLGAAPETPAQLDTEIVKFIREIVQLQTLTYKLYLVTYEQLKMQLDQIQRTLEILRLNLLEKKGNVLRTLPDHGNLPDPKLPKTLDLSAINREIALLLIHIKINLKKTNTTCMPAKTSQVPSWGIIFDQASCPTVIDAFMTKVFEKHHRDFLESLILIHTLDYEKETMRRTVKKKKQAARRKAQQRAAAEAQKNIASDKPEKEVKKAAPPSLSKKQIQVKQAGEAEFKRQQKIRLTLKTLIDTVFGPYYRTISWGEWEGALGHNGYTVKTAGNGRNEYTHLESGRQFRIENPHGDDSNKLHIRDIYDVRKFCSLEGLVPPGILPSHLIQPWLQELQATDH